MTDAPTLAVAHIFGRIVAIMQANEIAKIASYVDRGITVTKLIPISDYKSADIEL